MKVGNNAMEWLKKIRRRWHNDIAQWDQDLKDALIYEFTTQLNILIEKDAQDPPPQIQCPSPGSS